MKLGTTYVKTGGVFVAQGGSGGATGSGHHHSTFASSSPYASVVASSTTHTKGSWVELISSTSVAAETLIVEIGWLGTFTSNTDTATLLDIGVGAASSETALVSNLTIGHCQAGQRYEFPLAIAAGTRVSARVQSAVSSKSVDVAVSVRQAGTSTAAATSCTTIGVNTGTSTGTQLSAVPSTNTESTPTQLISSTAAAYTKLLVAFSAVGGTLTNSTGLIDIMVGGSGSETTLLENIGFATNSSEWIMGFGNSRWYDVNIPAGTRLSARFQNSTTTSSNRPAVALYAMP